MRESEFWWVLQMRMNSRSEEISLGYCDWFETKRYRFGPPEGHIEGNVGFVSGHRSASLPFDLIFPSTYRSTDDIDWASLLALIDSGGYIHLDSESVTISRASSEEFDGDA